MNILKIILFKFPDSSHPQRSRSNSANTQHLDSDQNRSSSSSSSMSSGPETEEERQNQINIALSALCSVARALRTGYAIYIHTVHKVLDVSRVRGWFLFSLFSLCLFCSDFSLFKKRNTPLTRVYAVSIFLLSPLSSLLSPLSSLFPLLFFSSPLFRTHA